MRENGRTRQRSFNWKRGERLEEARQLLSHLVAMVQAGRRDEISLDARFRATKATAKQMVTISRPVFYLCPRRFVG